MKILPKDNYHDLLAEIKKIRKNGEKITLTNGAFDLFHVGHLRYLKAAANYSEKLIVAVNADSSVKLSKGEDRPIYPESERAEIVSAIRGVDLVFIFSDKTVEKIIETVKPDFHAKGPDYTAENVPEKDAVLKNGGKVVICGDPKDHATTETIKKLNQTD